MEDQMLSEQARASRERKRGSLSTLISLHKSQSAVAAKVSYVQQKSKRATEPASTT